ncbi:MAG TPA: hypothetical protein VIY90_20505 [Steroidobacteraceae bacterium]
MVSQMMRWVRFAGQMLNQTPILMTMLLLMVTAWMAAGEIYEAAIQIPRHGATAAMVLMGLNVVCSWLLVFNLLALVHDMQELRLPQHRQLLVAGLVFIFAFIFVLPCLLVWSLQGGTRDVIMIAMGSSVGSAGAALWRTRSGTHSAPADRVNGARVPVPAQPASPWRAVRVALGPPYAPTSWQRRAVQLALLCVIVASAPILALSYARSPRPPVFNFLLNAGEFIGFLIAISLCWVWPLSRLHAILNPEGGALTELALLPGLGSGRQQLRRLCLVALSLPFATLMVLLIAAMAIATLQHMQQGVYLKLTLEFLLIPLITLPILLGQINQAHKVPSRFTVWLMCSQMCTFSVMMWSAIWNLRAMGTIAGHKLALLAGGLVLVVVLLIVGFSIQSLRKLLRRPHPFVEVAS